MLIFFDENFSEKDCESVYIDDLNETFRQFLQEKGFEVLKTELSPFNFYDHFIVVDQGIVLSFALGTCIKTGKPWVGISCWSHVDPTLSDHTPLVLPTGLCYDGLSSEWPRATRLQAFYRTMELEDFYGTFKNIYLKRNDLGC